LPAPTPRRVVRYGSLGRPKYRAATECGYSSTGRCGEREGLWIALSVPCSVSRVDTRAAPYLVLLASEQGDLWPLRRRAFHPHLWPLHASLQLLRSRGMSGTRFAEDGVKDSVSCVVHSSFDLVQEVRHVRLVAGLQALSGRICSTHMAGARQQTRMKARVDQNGRPADYANASWGQRRRTAMGGIL
jgi:hypothetical protein